MKIIITVVGKDTVGIIARVCTYLAEKQVNILDISQTIVQGYFNMMMIADMSASPESFEELSGGLEQAGEDVYKRQDPTIGLATVYRMLATLEEIGIVSRCYQCSLEQDFCVFENAESG